MKLSILHVGIDDLADVLRYVIGILDLWEDLGMALKLTQGKLGEIKSNNTTVRERMKDMLRAWLSGQGSGPKPSWQGLCTALRDRLVQRGDLAEEIECEILAKHS